jgi:cytochrome c-type biogenesis protein CcmH/NrfG
VEAQKFKDALPISSAATMLSMMEEIMAFWLVKLRISNSRIKSAIHWCTAKVRWVLSLLLALSTVSIAPLAIASGPDCDRLASIAADPDHQATPVDYGGIDGARVIEVCSQAVSEFPDNGRYWVQLGRGYLKLDRGQAMLDAFEKARELQYPVAWFALAVVYHTGNGIPQADLSLAETLYQDAYRRGVGYAALGLARLYDEPESPFFDLEKSDVWQSRFDALVNRLG